MYMCVCVCEFMSQYVSLRMQFINSVVSLCSILSITLSHLSIIRFLWLL